VTKISQHKNNRNVSAKKKQEANWHFICSILIKMKIVAFETFSMISIDSWHCIFTLHDENHGKLHNVKFCKSVFNQ